jgi:hypothetical protein
VVEISSIAERVKEAGAIAFGIVIFVGILTIPALFILGAEWASAHLLRPLIAIGWIAAAIDVLILLPLSVFRRLRGFTGSIIFISSFLFGLVTWLLSFVLTYALWGTWAVIIGILFLGGAVVPFALLATLFKGMWAPFFTVIALFVITFGSRLAGLSIAASSNE